MKRLNLPDFVQADVQPDKVETTNKGARPTAVQVPSVGDGILSDASTKVG